MFSILEKERCCEDVCILKFVRSNLHNTVFLFLILCIEIKECASSPCWFGGSCEDLIGGYKCHCTAPYEGVNCQKRECITVKSPFSAVLNLAQSSFYRRSSKRG